MEHAKDKLNGQHKNLRATTRRIAISVDVNRGTKRHLQVYAGCRRYADEAGWEVAHDPTPEGMMRRDHGGSAWDGVLGRVTPALGKMACQTGIPVVGVSPHSATCNLPRVIPDFEAAGTMAAGHLLGRGFRHLAYLGIRRDCESSAQLNGFRKVAHREGASLTMHRFARRDFENGSSGWERFVTGIRKWIESWETPVGIFATNDLCCRYLIDSCRSKGLHVCQDMAVVGQNNESEICECLEPSLTSIEMGYEQVGYRAAALLDHLMNGGAPPDRPERIMPTGLVPRLSTDALAVPDPVVARVQRFIAEHCRDRIQVKDVVAEVATNRRTLERRFREATGRGVAEEITRLRLEHAKRCMINTDLPMREIAKRSGFRCADHFYKVFARVEGIPPGQFLKEHAGQSPGSGDVSVGIGPLPARGGRTSGDRASARIDGRGVTTSARS